MKNKSKRPQTEKTLIYRMRDAVKNGDLLEPFKASDVKKWMKENDIRQEDGSRYASDYHYDLTSNSYIEAKNETATNVRCLDRKRDEDSKPYGYWFLPMEQWIIKGYK